MRFVILSHGEIPGFGVSGPVLTPQQYELHQVLKWIAAGVDIREAMDDGTYRKLSFNDPKLLKAIDNGYTVDHVENPKIVDIEDEEVEEEEEDTNNEKVYPPQNSEEDYDIEDNGGFELDTLEDEL